MFVIFCCLKENIEIFLKEFSKFLLQALNIKNGRKFAHRIKKKYKQNGTGSS